MLALHTLPAAVQTLPKVAAETIATTTSNFASTITINKGRSQGIVIGDAVISNGGLVGRVVAASHGTATVQLLTDGQFKVGIVYGNDQFATLQGQGAGKPLALNDVSPNTKITKKTALVTNGLAGAQFPRNIPVARIVSIHTVSGATQKAVLAEPLADLGTLTYVQVVQWSPSPTGAPTGHAPTT